MRSKQDVTLKDEMIAPDQTYFQDSTKSALSSRTTPAQLPWLPPLRCCSLSGRIDSRIMRKKFKNRKIRANRTCVEITPFFEQTETLICRRTSKKELPHCRVGAQGLCNRFGSSRTNFLPYETTGSEQKENTTKEKPRAHQEEPTHSAD